MYFSQSLPKVAHHLLFFSRLGPYDRALFDQCAYGGEFTEQWAHEASVIPVETWPLLHHRMQAFRLRPWEFDRFAAEHREYCDWVLDEVRRRGPLGAADLPAPPGVERLEGTWYSSVQRATLEMHFARGRLAVVRREGMARVYEVAERALPARATPPALADADRELVRMAARAYGIATAADLADYWRMPVRSAAPRIRELVDSGDLLEAAVEGWRSPGYLHRDRTAPPTVAACALISPFDPLVWYRARAERLFGFNHRFEIFVPAERRKWGAYVLPFLKGESLAARVDLKSDRANRALLVPAAFVEEGVDQAEIAGALAVELRLLAGWLQLPRIIAPRRGNLARALAAQLK